MREGEGEREKIVLRASFLLIGQFKDALTAGAKLAKQSNGFAKVRVADRQSIYGWTVGRRVCHPQASKGKSE